MNKRQFPVTDLYCITASRYSLGRSNEEVVSAMLAAGIKIVQYREKDLPMQQKYRECMAIKELCAKHDACFIVNDDVALTMAVEADGVHLGQDDLPVDVARKLVGDKMIIGLSTHSPEQVDAAAGLDIDYIGVGPLYYTETKVGVCAAVGLEYLDYVVKYHHIPFVAIGGIKRSNVADVIKHGASCTALVTEIVGAADIGAMIGDIRAEISGAKAG
ncbi:thiamine phosphate synthase [Chloroflexota bacterium]